MKYTRMFAEGKGKVKQTYGKVKQTVLFYGIFFPFVWKLHDDEIVIWKSMSYENTEHKFSNSFEPYYNFILLVLKKLADDKFVFNNYLRE